MKTRETRARGGKLALRLAAICIAAASASATARAEGAPPEPPYATVTKGHPIEFPRDFGSHPSFRTEWWYATGWLTLPGSANAGESLGFQVTFFRTRPAIDAANPSAFAPHQLLIAHCALSDPQRGRLWQDQKIRRAGMGLARAAEGDTDIQIESWSLRRADAVYAVDVAAEDFTLRLELAPTQAPLLNGEDGVSRKGAAAQAASYYYSLPHLAVRGTIIRNGRRDAVRGEAWLDHEWSSEYLESGAVGWDWIGINFADGAALMAFEIRGAHHEARWSGGTLRAADGAVQILAPGQVSFLPRRTWRSPRTGTTYPVEWHVRAGTRELDLKPLMDDQENDTRLSTGAVYWEGAVQAYEPGHAAGRGYLELTGYQTPLSLR
ncbi:MAG: lipocalin-like domain-containing protein [Steroidobacteraceae bacterium]